MQRYATLRGLFINLCGPVCMSTEFGRILTWHTVLSDFSISLLFKNFSTQLLSATADFLGWLVVFSDTRFRGILGGRKNGVCCQQVLTSSVMSYLQSIPNFKPRGTPTFHHQVSFILSQTFSNQSLSQFPTLISHWASSSKFKIWRSSKMDVDKNSTGMPAC